MTVIYNFKHRILSEYYLIYSKIDSDDGYNYIKNIERTKRYEIFFTIILLHFYQIA